MTTRKLGRGVAVVGAGYDRQNPYTSGIVQLDEGVAISAEIIGLDSTQPEQIAIGTPLQATFVERPEGEKTTTHLAFKA